LVFHAYIIEMQEANSPGKISSGTDAEGGGDLIPTLKG
jgi:hypothetical protein